MKSKCKKTKIGYTIPCETAIIEALLRFMKENPQEIQKFVEKSTLGASKME